MPLITCVKIQDYLNTQCADPSNIRTPVGLLQSVTSDVNQKGISFIQSVGGTGKKRQVELIYSQRALPSEVSTVPVTAYCDAVTPVEQRSITLDANLSFSMKRTFDSKEIKSVCENRENIIRSEVMNMFDALNVRINDALIAFVAANPGTLYGGGAPVTLDLIAGVAPNTVENYDHYDRLMDNLSDLGCGGMPMLVGNGELRQFARRLKVGCCNTNQGVNYAEVNGEFYFFKDNRIAPLLAGNRMIAYVPGAIQIAPFLNNLVDPESDDANEESTIMDPLTGLMWDYNLVKDNCGKKYHLTLELNLAFFINPINRYKVGDALAGTNGVLIYAQA